MSTTDNPAGGGWDKIQTGIKDTERLIGQKKYNMAMIKARQTLECMVKALCEQSGIMQGNLIDMIDALYEDGVISRTTSEHYHKIRTIGNKAIHEDDNNSYNASQAHHLLAQEVYTFINDYSGRRKKAAPPQRRPVPDGSVRRGGRPSASSNASRRRRGAPQRRGLDPGSIIKPLLLIAIIIALIFIIKMIRPAEEKAPETSSEPVTEAPAETPAMSIPPSEIPTTEAAAAPVVRYKTTDALNVRSAPSTDAATKIGLLTLGTEVEFVSDYDDTWCVIKYNGQDAYVSKEFLTPVQ